ncbi:unnamed protein product [Caenorhabditis angaria]|uniref:Transmembrane protein n=1 Tax=Caenorhabditis angaria TaxID=860376 RepID=A0A9P1IS16_9PELO|nr:unnamed protein product [Caenorhabditis angaria]
MKIIKNIIVFLLIIITLAKSAKKTKKTYYQLCPVLTNATYKQSPEFINLTMRNDCKFCHLTFHRETAESEFILNAMCLTDGSKHEKRLKELIAASRPIKCFKRYFDSNTLDSIRKYGCFATGFHAIVQHHIWITFFSSQDTENTEAMMRMIAVEREKSEHEHLHRDKRGYTHEISYVSWAVLFATYFIFFILTMLQYEFNNDGILY